VPEPVGSDAVVPAEPTGKPATEASTTGEPATERITAQDAAVQPPAEEPPGQPLAAGEPLTDATPLAAAPGSERARRRRKAVLVGIGVLAVVLLAAIVVAVGSWVGHRGTDKSLQAKQGDCLSGQSDSDLKRTACGSPSAEWRVVGVVANKTREEAKQQACRDWPTSEASYWESRNGKTGFVLCLAATTAK
jgi:hypothetical protein